MTCDIANMLNAKQLSSIKPDFKEVCKNVKPCHSQFVSEMYFFHKRISFMLISNGIIFVFK